MNHIENIYISGLIYESKELEKHRLKQKLLSFRGETCGGKEYEKRERKIGPSLLKEREGFKGFCY